MRSRKKLAVTNRLRKIKKNVKKLSMRRHLQYTETSVVSEN